MAEQPTQKAIYTIKAPGFAADILALHVTIRDPAPSGRIELCFFDTQRGHMFPGTITGRTADGFTFQNENMDGDIWIFREVTLRRFRHSVYKTVGNGEAIAAAMKDTNDLWEWYRKEFPLDSGW